MVGAVASKVSFIYVVQSMVGVLGAVEGDEPVFCWSYLKSGQLSWLSCVGLPEGVVLRAGRVGVRSAMRMSGSIAL